MPKPAPMPPAPASPCWARQLLDEAREKETARRIESEAAAAQAAALTAALTTRREALIEAMTQEATAAAHALQTATGRPLVVVSRLENPNGLHGLLLRLPDGRGDSVQLTLGPGATSIRLQCEVGGRLETRHVGVELDEAGALVLRVAGELLLPRRALQQLAGPMIRLACARGAA